MTNKIYHLGHEASSTTGHGPFDYWADPSTFDQKYSRSSACTGGNIFYESYFEARFASEDDPIQTNTVDGVWEHVLVKHQGEGEGEDIFVLTNAEKYCVRVRGGPAAPITGERKLRCILYDADNLNPVNALSDYAPAGYFNGTGFLQVDVHVFSEGGNGRCDVYLNRELFLSVTNPDRTPGPVTVARWRSTSRCWWSEIAGANFDTRFKRVWTIPVTGPGKYSESAGGWDAVDDIAPDASGAVFSSDGQRLNCATAGITPIPYSVDGVALAVRASTDVDGVLYPHLVVGDEDCLGNTPLVENNQSALPAQEIYTLNPVTGLPWAGDLSVVQPGVWFGPLPG